MRTASSIFVTVCLIGSAALAAEPPGTQPASAPATQPAGGAIRGRVSAGAGLDLQKPDLSHAVVYLMPDQTLGPVPASLPRAMMGQRDKTFIPSFIVVPCGTEVEFPNWDHISHNVFSRSKAAPAFDLDRYPYGYSKTRTFDKVGVVQVFCNIHQQMRAVIVVTPNPFFARADADGRFEMKGIPPGRHELVVWHERCEDQHHFVDVTAGPSPELSFVLEESRRSIIANDPPERRSGYGVERGLGVKRERLDLPVVKDAHPRPSRTNQRADAMRLRTKLFIIWGAVVLLLWAGTWWSVRRSVQLSFDKVASHGFSGTRRDLHRLQAERVRGMRQAAAMVMNIPELRALIAEHNFEVSSENLDSLQERLDNLSQVVGVSFVCVLDARGNVIAQNHASPWKTLPELIGYLKNSPQGTAMVNRIFRGASTTSPTVSAEAFGIWSSQDRLFHVVGVPLIFNSDAGGQPAADGGLIMAAALTDDLAADLAQSHDCQVSFVAGGKLVACSLPPALKAELQAAGAAFARSTGNTFDLTLGGTSYRSSMEVLTDPCSGEPVGAMLIQSDLKDARAAHDSVSKRLIACMAGGLLAAALASFIVSSAVTRPVRELSRGVQQLATCDLDVSILVRSQDELGALARAFNDMVRQLRVRRELERLVEESRAISQAKSQFLATMSHEIRTPLNGVIGMAELLLRTTLNDRQRRYAGMVKSSAEVLTALINDILDFSKIEAGKLELETVDFNLHELTEDVVELLAIKAQAKGLQVACDIRPGVPSCVRGDPTRVRQVIVNLLNNAVKFTETGEVVVSILQDPADGASKQIRVEVRDTGIGIPRERMDRLFQFFSQVDASTTRRFGGTGLGLAICKQLVELMGGKIGVKSDAGAGSIFWFALPLPKREGREIEAATPANLLAEMRVLIVDANSTYRNILCQMLTNWGSRPEAVASEQDAIAALDRAQCSGKPFRIIIADGKDIPAGGELLRSLREQEDRKNIQALLLVPLGTEPDADGNLAPNVAGYVTKPIRQGQLNEALLAAVSGKTPARATPSVPASQQPGSDAPSFRILVAEDNEINQMVVADLLTDTGFACDVVDDGQAALAAFERGGYDLILMDCQMPRMDGFAATREIRSRESAGATPAHIPIVALTANTSGSDRDECLAAGMDSYVGKPFKVDQLLQAIRSLLRSNDVRDTGDARDTAVPAAPETSRSEIAEAPTADPSPTPLRTGQTSVSEASPQDVATQPGAQESSAAFDINGMIGRCSGSAALATAVLEKFEKQSTELITGLKRALDKAEFDEMARMSHRVKGTAGIMAAGGLHAAAARLEDLSRARETADMADELERLSREVEKCVAYAVTARSQLKAAVT